MKAFLYIRVSTDEQADKGYSQRSQQEILMRYCAINGITVINSFFEDHSAKTFNRPEFNNLLLQLHKHRNMADLVLFTKWDRFSRNAGDAYQMISRLNKLEVSPQAIEQPLNLEIPENKMMLAFYLAAPEVENDRRALNVFNGMRRAKKEGRYMGQAPLGYKNKTSEDGRKFIAPDENAPLVKWIFEQLATGKYTAESVWNIAKEKGLKCEKNTYWNAIRNEGYCGIIKIPAYKTEEEQFVEATHEPIISKELFFRVQDVLNGKKKVQRTKILVDERFPLRGFLICPKCGKLLTASSSKGRKIYYHYYHCISSCGTRYKAEAANDALIQELIKWKPHSAMQPLYKIILQNLYKESATTRNIEKSKIKKDLEEISLRQKKALNLLMIDAMETDDYKIIKRECEMKTIQLEGKYNEISAAQIDIQPLVDKALKLLENIDTYYASCNAQRKREIIDSIFPEKLQFDGEAYRTTRINEAVRVMFNIGEGLGEIKMGQIHDLSELSHNVIWLGLEPRTHTLKVYCSTN